MTDSKTTQPELTVADLMNKLKQECDAAEYKLVVGEMYIHILHHNNEEDWYVTSRKGIQLAREDVEMRYTCLQNKA